MKLERTGKEASRIKDPEDWVTGDEEMTGAQACVFRSNVITASGGS